MDFFLRGKLMRLAIVLMLLMIAAFAQSGDQPLWGPVCRGSPIRPNHLLRMLPRSLGQLRPDSMRATSSVRSSPVICRTVVLARPLVSRFSISNGDRQR
jgi:hypothetical protein